MQIILKDFKQKSPLGRMFYRDVANDFTRSRWKPDFTFYSVATNTEISTCLRLFARSSTGSSTGIVRLSTGSHIRRPTLPHFVGMGSFYICDLSGIPTQAPSVLLGFPYQLRRGSSFLYLKPLKDCG